MTSRVGKVMHTTNKRYVRQQRHSLEQVATDFPVSATAETVEAGWDEAVQQALDKYHPMLLMVGLTATHGQSTNDLITAPCSWPAKRVTPCCWRPRAYPMPPCTHLNVWPWPWMIVPLPWHSKPKP